MIPQTDIRYNYQYAKRLYTGEKPFDDAWVDILKYGSDFEEVFEAIRDRVLAVIPAVTGYEWGEHSDPFIPVYIVDSDESLSQPMTIVASDDTTRMLVDTTTQLIDQNILYGFKKPAQRDAAVQKMTTAVLQRLGIDALDALQDIHAFYVERYGESYKVPDWDLSTQTARSYLESRS